MRTIYYNDEDIKKCKLALVNQNLTSLQSAFLKQYINNLEYELQQKEYIINKAREYCDFGVREWITDDGFVEKVLKDVKKILDNKGEYLV